MKYGNNYKSFTRKIEIPKPGFCVKNEVDPSVLSSPKRYANNLSGHSYSHPDKEHNFLLVGLVTAAMFKKVFQKVIDSCLNDPDRYACIIEGPKWRYFVYGGEFGGTILRNNTSFPRYYCLGLNQRRLTWSWFTDPNIGQEEQDQIFEAAVSREVNSRISQKSAKGEKITSEQKKRIKQTVRQTMNQWRTSNPSLCKRRGAFTLITLHAWRGLPTPKSEQVKSDLPSTILLLKQCFKINQFGLNII